MKPACSPQRPAAALLSMFMVAACAVGPDYVPPATTMAPAWITEIGDGDLEASWWETFGDPTLTALVTTAIQANKDIDEADARLKEARAAGDAVRSRRSPGVNAGAAVTENRLSENGQLPIGQVPGLSRDLSLYDAGFDAAWELDLWGGVRRAVEGVDARTQAAEEARRSVLLQVIAEVARAYIDLRQAEALHASATADVTAQARMVSLISDRERVGAASRYDVVRAQSQARSIAAFLPNYAADADAAVYRLAVLTGDTPETLQATLPRGRRLPDGPGRVEAGLRSDLLTRRPDVRRAERELAAATADIGVATAELFPRVSLLGAVGVQAKDANDLLSSDSLRFQAGPSLRWPILSAGRIRAQIRAADARADAAGARYQSAVLQALADSETVLNRYDAAIRTRIERQAARQDAAEALELARNRFRSGEEDLTAVLLAESAWASVDRAAIQAHAAELHQLAALYKALGGGWEFAEVMRGTEASSGP